jgi:hypothetical protein
MAAAGNRERNAGLHLRGWLAMNHRELEWRLQKAAINKDLHQSVRQTCVEAARKLHEIEQAIRRARTTPMESLAEIAVIIRK